MDTDGYLAEDLWMEPEDAHRLGRVIVPGRGFNIPDIAATEETTAQEATVAYRQPSAADMDIVPAAAKGEAAFSIKGEGFTGQMRPYQALKTELGRKEVTGAKPLQAARKDFGKERAYEAHIPVVLPKEPVFASAELNVTARALRCEAEDAMLYEWLCAHSTGREDREILGGILEDEKKHASMLCRLGAKCDAEARLAAPMTETPASYEDGLKTAILREQRSVADRCALLAADTPEKSLAAAEILTDEVRHLGLCNYLYAKNRTH